MARVMATQSSHVHVLYSDMSHFGISGISPGSQNKKNESSVLNSADYVFILKQLKHNMVENGDTNRLFRR